MVHKINNHYNIIYMYINFHVPSNESTFLPENNFFEYFCILLLNKALQTFEMSPSRATDVPSFQKASVT